MVTTRTRALAGAVLAALLLLGGCARLDPGRSAAAGPTPGADGSAQLERNPEFAPPPPVTLRFADRSIELAPHAYCYRSACVDGVPPAALPDVGSPEQLVVDFPLPGWSFTAQAQPSGEKCARLLPVPVEEAGDQEFVIRPGGYAGIYDVTLFGRGDGSLSVTFRWTTPVDGPLPEPHGRLAVLADHDGKVDSYGVELELTHLARTPKEASAKITVRSESGRAVSFDATRAHLACLPEGTVYWDGPRDRGLEAAGLGGESFTYEVEVLLDGVRHVAVARWPQDRIQGNEPSVGLRFSPPLPAMS